MNTIVAMDSSGSYRVYISISTEMVREARRIHESSNLATTALGRSITAAAMMGLMLKGDGDKLSLIFKGDGPLREIVATANARGQVKGYAAAPDTELPLTENGKYNVGAALGKGSLTVIRDLGLKEPYVGRIDLVSGEIAEDLTQYFASSEQQPSSVALGVRIDEKGEITAAGGMIVQIMPGAEKEAVDKLEETLFFMDAFTLLIEDAEQDPEKLMELIFGKMPEQYRPRILERRNVEWRCDCSRERMEQALVSIGKKDMIQMIEEDGQAELTCQFCRSSYKFNREELQELLRYAQH